MPEVPSDVLRDLFLNVCDDLIDHGEIEKAQHLLDDITTAFGTSAEGKMVKANLLIAQGKIEEGLALEQEAFNELPYRDEIKRIVDLVGREIQPILDDLYRTGATPSGTVGWGKE